MTWGKALRTCVNWLLPCGSQLHHVRRSASDPVSAHSTRNSSRSPAPARPGSVASAGRAGLTRRVRFAANALTAMVGGHGVKIAGGVGK
jgi:hypothetical protein